MSNKERFDWSTFSDKGTSEDLWGKSIRRSVSYDSYTGNQVFRARALTDMFPLNSKSAMPLDGGSSGGTGGGIRYAFKARILGDNTPHSFLPDPCDPAYTGDQDLTYKIISMHTTFISTSVKESQAVTRGDIVMVELNKADQSYDLKYGRFLNLSSAENPGDATDSECFSLKSLVGGWAPNVGTATTPAGTTPAASVVVGAAARAAALAAGTPLGDIKLFYSEVIKQVGGTPNDEILKFFGAWGNLEQPKTTNNPLATTHPGKDSARQCRPWADDPKMSTFNSACVRNYSTFETGVKATVATLTNGYYPTIVKFIKGTSGFPLAIDALADAEIRKELDRWGSKGHKVYGRLSAGKTDNPSTVITAPATAVASSSTTPECPAGQEWHEAGFWDDGSPYPAKCYDI